MKKVIDESRMLVNLARALGQQPDPMLVKQIETYDELQKQVQTIEEQIHKEHDVPTQKYLQDIFALAKDLKKVQHTIVEQKIVPPNAPEMSSIQQLAEEMSRYVKVTEDFQQPNIPAVKDLEALTSKVRMIEQWVTNISSTGPGSGEVNFRYLDDVNRSTMTAGNDGWVLEYDVASKKVQFTKDVGPIDSLLFDITHVDSSVHPEGTLTWNAEDKTLNLHHSNDIRQQIGQETYFLVKNNTGSTITHGTSVRFAGATAGDGQEARLLIAPWLANGTYPSLYTVGIVTEDIANGEEGFVTNFGKLRDLNTTGSPVSETWQVGDILYAHPTITGALTNAKPTAPDNVVPMAAVLKVGTTDGELFVRPTIYPTLHYATFVDNTNQTHVAINTPKAISYDTTEIANGHRIDTDPNDSNRPTRVTALVSGLYNYKFSIQLVSTNSSAKDVWIWFRKNGVDIQDSATRKTIVGNDVYDVAAWDFTVSMDINDYFQIMWAVSGTAVTIPAPAATAFCPAIPSVILNVTEAAL